MNTNTVQLASEYNTVSSEYLQKRIHDVALSLIDFEKDDDVLDVGCGPGKLCKSLSSLVNSVIGFDVSPGMIEFARRENSAPNVQFFVEDAQTFGDHHVDWREKFNKIVSMVALHWCKDIEGALRNIFNCLKPGGTFLQSLTLKWQLNGLTSSYGETGVTWAKKHPKWGSFLKDYEIEVFFPESSDKYLECMQSVGFTVKKVKFDPAPWVQWDEKLVKAQLRVLFSPLKQIPIDLHGECIDDVYRWLYDVTPKTSDGLLLGEFGRYEVMMIVATRE